MRHSHISRRLSSMVTILIRNKLSRVPLFILMFHNQKRNNNLRRKLGVCATAVATWQKSVSARIWTYFREKIQYWIKFVLIEPLDGLKQDMIHKFDINVKEVALTKPAVTLKQKDGKEQLIWRLDHERMILISVIIPWKFTDDSKKAKKPDRCICNFWNAIKTG